MPTERSRLLGERRSDIQSSLDDSRSFGSTADGIEANKGLISRLRYGRDRLWTILYATFVASLGSFSFGYCLGYSSPVLVQLGDPSFATNISKAPFNTSSIPTDFFGVSFCCFVHFAVLVTCVTQLRSVPSECFYSRANGPNSQPLVILLPLGALG